MHACDSRAVRRLFCPCRYMTHLGLGWNEKLGKPVYPLQFSERHRIRPNSHSPANFLQCNPRMLCGIVVRLKLSAIKLGTNCLRRVEHRSTKVGFAQACTRQVGVCEVSTTEIHMVQNRLP